jgi:hypothetical protein
MKPFSPLTRCFATPQHDSLVFTTLEARFRDSYTIRVKHIFAYLKHSEAPSLLMTSPHLPIRSREEGALRH